MNILILVSSFNFGGAEKQAVLDANMLSTAHNVTMAAFEPGRLAEHLNPEVNQVILKKENYLFTAVRLARFIRSNNIDLVHNHLFAPMVISSLATLLVKVPVIWHFHGHHFEVNKLILRVLSRLPSVKKLLFVCSPLQNYFMKHFKFPARKVEVVYNSTEGINPATSHDGQQKIKIGFIGRLVALKRVEYLVEMAAYLKSQSQRPFEIQVLGDGPEREDLVAYAKKLNVSEEVKFLGFQTDLKSFYQKFDLFVLPSREEALSLSLIDSGSAGVPALAFDVGGNKEIVINGETGYIVDSREELFEKADKLIRDKTLREKMGTKAVRHTEIFSEKNHLEKLESIYKQYV